MTQDTLAQARQALQEMIEAARKGTLIPARLAGQLEAIDVLLETAAKPAPAVESGSGDQAAFLKEQAYIISHAVHELRTPMTSIRGYSDMLGNPVMGALNDMQKQFIETIRTNSRRMDGLLTDVSDIAKIRGGTLKINPKMDMFKNVAMMVEKAMAPQMEQTGRRLILETPQGLPFLNTDGELLAKALSKLVDNGLRYSEKTDGSVTLRARGEQNMLVIEVQDDGFGMTPEDFAQLGTLYFRSEDERVRAYKGSGLGIPVAYGIIRMLGGTISAQSSIDAGSLFAVTMPGMT